MRRAVLHEAGAVLERQLRAASEVDSKLTQMILLNSTFLVGLGSAAAAFFSIEQRRTFFLDPPVTGAIIMTAASMASLLFVESLVLSILGFTHGKIAIGLRAEDLESAVEGGPTEETFLRSAAVAYVAGIRGHRIRNDVLGRTVRRSRGLFFVGLALLGVAFGTYLVVEVS